MIVEGVSTDLKYSNRVKNQLLVLKRRGLMWNIDHWICKGISHLFLVQVFEFEKQWNLKKTMNKLCKT